MTRRKFIGLLPASLAWAVSLLFVSEVKAKPRYIKAKDAEQWSVKQRIRPGMRRKSVRKNDIGYDPLATQYKVYFNGKELKRCFTADEWTGEAWVWGKNNLDEHRLIGKVKLIAPKV